MTIDQARAVATATSRPFFPQLPLSISRPQRTASRTSLNVSRPAHNASSPPKNVFGPPQNVSGPAQDTSRPSQNVSGPPQDASLTSTLAAANQPSSNLKDISGLERDNQSLSLELGRYEIQKNHELSDALAAHNLLETALRQQITELEHDYEWEVQGKAESTIQSISQEKELKTATSDLQTAKSELQALQKKITTQQATINHLRITQSSSEASSNRLPSDSAPEQTRQLQPQLRTIQEKSEVQKTELEALKEKSEAGKTELEAQKIELKAPKTEVEALQENATLEERLSMKVEKPDNSDLVKTYQLRRHLTQVHEECEGVKANAAEAKRLADLEIKYLRARVEHFERQVKSTKRPAPSSQSLAAKRPKLPSDTPIDDDDVTFLPKPPQSSNATPSSNGHFACLVPANPDTYFHKVSLPTSILKTITEVHIPQYDRKGKSHGKFLWQQQGKFGYCAYVGLLLRGKSVFTEPDRACETCVSKKRPCIVGRQVDKEEFAVLLPLPESKRPNLAYTDPGFWVTQ